MTKVIDGRNAVLGRLATYVAKEVIKGEDIVIVNCSEVIVTGNRRDIKSKFEKRRQKVGSGFRGPKYSRVDEKIVKRAIRGMIPNHRQGRGKEIFKKIMCYRGVPKEFEKEKMISIEGNRGKFIKVKEIYN